MGRINEDDYDKKIDKLVTMTVAAVKGIVPMGQVALPIAQIAKDGLAPPGICNFAQALSHILAGKRDYNSLTAHLAPELAETVQKTLDLIEAPLTKTDESKRTPLTLEQLIEKVAEACGGEVILWNQLWEFTTGMVDDNRLPQEVRELADVLRKILAGERQRHVLDGLSSDEHQQAVQKLLDRLNTK